jgi:hypothetical protein
VVTARQLARVGPAVGRQQAAIEALTALVVRAEHRNALSRQTA